MIMHRAGCGYGLFVEHYEKYDDLMWNWPCLGLIPENGSAGGAGAGLIIPGIGRVRARRLSWWLWRGRHRLAARRLSRGRAGNGSRGVGRRARWRLAERYRLSGSGSHGGASLARIACRAVAHVVPQGRPDYLPAPLGAGPPGVLRAR